MSFWANLVGYQLTWFITVIGAAHGDSWPAVTAAGIFCLIHLAMPGQRLLDLKLIGLALTFGLVSDGSLAVLHFVSYAAPGPAGGAPIWILSLWSAFAVTLNRSLAWLQRHPPAAAAFGALGGPLAYSGAAKGWGAVHFVPPIWRGELWLAVSWATSMYLFARVIRGASNP